MAPDADLLFFADARWHAWHAARPEFQAFAGDICTIENTGDQCAEDRVHFLRNANPNGSEDGKLGLSDDPHALRTGYSSAFMLLNLSVLAGARRIVLLGHDCKPAADGRRHWFGDHPEPTMLAAMRLWAKAFEHVAPLLSERGVKVVNASPGSALTCFPAMPVDQALAWATAP